MVVLELMVVLMVLMVLLTTPGQVGADSRGHGAHRRRGDWGVKTCQFMQYLSNHIKPHHISYSESPHPSYDTQF